jgi:hypothetical protein
VASCGRNESDRVRSIEFGRIGRGREGDDVFTGEVDVDILVGEAFVGEV